MCPLSLILLMLPLPTLQTKVSIFPLNLTKFFMTFLAILFFVTSPGLTKNLENLFLY